MDHAKSKQPGSNSGKHAEGMLTRWLIGRPRQSPGSALGVSRKKHADKLKSFAGWCQGFAQSVKSGVRPGRCKPVRLSQERLRQRLSCLQVPAEKLIADRAGPDIRRSVIISVSLTLEHAIPWAETAKTTFAKRCRLHSIRLSCYFRGVHT